MGNCISSTSDENNFDGLVNSIQDHLNLLHKWEIPECDPDQKSKELHLLISGYTRIYIENYYLAILNIIILFYHNGFAEYIIISNTTMDDFLGSLCMDQNNDDNKRLKVKLGDMIKIGNDPVFIWGENIRIPCYFKYTKCTSIPYEICSKLKNAVEYYSKIMSDEFKNELTKNNTWTLYVKHDDEYIMNTFGGPINKRYRNIKLIFRENRLFEFKIEFNGIGKKTFNPSYWNYSTEDIDKFYRIRVDSYGATVEMPLISISFSICPAIERNAAHPICYISPYWDLYKSYGNRMNWVTNTPRPRKEQTHFIEFIGRASEKEKMVQQIRENYKQYKIKKMTIIDIKNYSRYVQGDEK